MGSTNPKTALKGQNLKAQSWPQKAPRKMRPNLRLCYTVPLGQQF